MSNELQSENPNTQSTVGQDFASSISVADLAIRSTAYTPPDPLPDIPRTKRRVTFNLQDIQVQTIPAYDSASSSSSEISLDIIKPERISKKESYDALLQRKQLRRDHPNTNTSTITAATTTTATTTTAKPGYWYPLASPRSSLMHTPISSLERTESLINETIQRELYSNPTPPSPSISPDTNSALDEPTIAFDQIPISANNNVMIISPPSSLHEDPIWVDHPTLLLNPLPQEPRTSLFFVKILKAESLDFPIDNGK